MNGVTAADIHRMPPLISDCTFPVTHAGASVSLVKPFTSSPFKSMEISLST